MSNPNNPNCASSITGICNHCWKYCPNCAAIIMPQKAEEPSLTIDLSKPPYYDKFNPEDGYVKILTHPGRPAQSREIIELQSMLGHQIQTVGDTLMRDGSAVEGCIVNTHPDKKAVTVTEGRVYVGGMVYSIERQTVEIDGSGDETINVAFTEQIITADDDPSLRDPAQGMGNYGQKGADRLRRKVFLVANDPTKPKLCDLKDGMLIIEETHTTDLITDTLARRAYDADGSFVVRGLKLIDPVMNDNNFVYTTLEMGKAYVRGYEITKPSPTQLKHVRPTTTKEVFHEPKVFSNTINTYPLNNNPVHKVTQMVATIEVTQNITRQGFPGSMDALPHFPVVSISNISQGGTTYRHPQDYLINGDNVDWSPAGGVEPVVGTTYSCTWRYTRVMEEGRDYILVDRPGTNSKWVQFLSAAEGAIRPANNSQFTISYEFMLARKDAVALAKNGAVLIMEGVPDVENLTIIPDVDDPDILYLGSVLIRPRNNVPIIFNRPITRLTVADMYSVLTRINDLEYNQAVDNLDREAMDGEPATLLKGVYTDGFLGFTKCDTFHPLFSAAVDIPARECTLAAVERFLPQDSGSASYNSIRRWGNGTATLDFTETMLLQQSIATQSMKINEYQAFPARPLLTRLTPNVDNWIETNEIYIDGGTHVTTMNLRRWWMGANTVWTDAERRAWDALGADAQAESQRSNGANQVTLSSSTVSSHILDEAIMFMRQIDVTFEADRFKAFENNLYGVFDGRTVSLTPTAAPYQGTKAGTLRADNLGRVQGKFRIPADVRTGTREFMLSNEDSSQLCSATYTANGRLLTTVTTTTKFDTVVNFTTQVNPPPPPPAPAPPPPSPPIDPLAQTVYFDRDRVLTGVGVYFASKDATNTVTVQIREVVNGYPGAHVLAAVVLQPSQCLASANGTVETKVSFPVPVFVKAGDNIAICVVTESATDSLYVAEMGKFDILNPQNQLMSNPYLDGVLFSSSNNMAWTAHQSMDMKFRIYTANFAKEGTITWSRIQGIEIDTIMMIASYVNPARTSVNFELNLDNLGWQSIWEYTERELTSVAKAAQLRCTMKTTEFNSPAINLASVGLIGFLNNLTAQYVSRNVEALEPFNNIKQVIDVYAPAGTGFVIEYATDISGTNWQSANPIASMGVGKGWTRFTYERQLAAAVMNYRVKVRMTTNNPCIRPRIKNLMSILKNM